ncbi:hypothetical protein BK751_08390 [Bacillus thuringiensis serovar galleriae]|uniref:Gp45 n=2 Tax=Lwoffvirus TP21 TaxID=57478 RepID=B8R854_9CAUD|nr:gp45 [Bacillus phage TP21-L]ANT40064.1 hypothetical protein BMBtpLA3_29 [Bacillus phage BMBtpLA3]EXY08856.1 hypothetical protein BF15_04555 [Bacillus thuringiensis]OTW66692.1 hypothetical protein BK701_07690 [Bacillus thuringiensis serovar amagiensis]OTY65841.1 hypothetical protein BK747_14080 [Bacillus thuringiensis serovar azorensis]OTY91888.1 hypothetical protein BK751_08390 [Bacillus thuringiensis serovar galleriae]OTZ55281.1 hypothetical protein BK766_18160 [Bacillus thuringiensis ser
MNPSKYKSKPMKEWTDTELILCKHDTLRDTYSALDKGYYNSAHAYTRILSNIKNEIERRGMKA